MEIQIEVCSEGQKVGVRICIMALYEEVTDRTGLIIARSAKDYGLESKNRQ